MKDDLVTDRLKFSQAQLNSTSPSMCLAKWYQVTLHLHNAQSQSCHHVKSTPIQVKELPENPTALHNTPLKMQARLAMLKGKRPKECSYCWKIEDRGRISDRVMKSAEPWAAPFLADAVGSGRGERIHPRYVEISFDSVCNFKCMYCSPSYSTLWMKEIQTLGPYPTSKRFNDLNLQKWNGTIPLEETDRRAMIESFWTWWPKLVGDLQVFRVTGGEPFLAAETWKLLDWLVVNPQPQLQLAINSNMSLRGEKFEQMLTAVNKVSRNVKRFTIYTSVDTWGAKAEYIRYGMDFERFHSNVEQLLVRSENPIRLSFMITVNALSLSGLQQLLAWILDLRRRYPQHGVGFDTPYLQNPRHMSIEILPKSFVQYVDDAVQWMTASQSTGDLIGFWPSEIVKLDRLKELILNPSFGRMQAWVLHRDFYRMFAEYDKRRGLDFLATFPEYEEFYRKCESRNWI